MTNQESILIIICKLKYYPPHVGVYNIVHILFIV
jgi:hypothetical protein